MFQQKVLQWNATKQKSDYQNSSGDNFYEKKINSNFSNRKKFDEKMYDKNSGDKNLT